MSKSDIEEFLRNKYKTEKKLLETNSTNLNCAIKSLSEISNNEPITIKGVNKFGTDFEVTSYIHMLKNKPLVNVNMLSLDFTDKYNIKKIVGVYEFNNIDGLSILKILDSKQKVIFNNPNAMSIIEQTKENGLLNLVKSLKKEELQNNENLNANLSAYIANSNVGKPATIVNGLKINYGVINSVCNNLVELKDGNLTTINKITNGTQIYIGKPMAKYCVSQNVRLK